MTTYYVCSVPVAKQYCSGMAWMEVYYWGNEGILKESKYSNTDHTVALLTTQLDESAQIVLTLVDPLFRKVTGKDMTISLREYVISAMRVGNI